LDAVLRDNITLAHYAAGHMIYIHEPSLVKLRQDLLDFGF
jgi:carboxypeptidase C (cathepsin A)